MELSHVNQANGLESGAERYLLDLMRRIGKGGRRARSARSLPADCPIFDRRLAASGGCLAASGTLDVHFQRIARGAAAAMANDEARCEKIGEVVLGGGMGDGVQSLIVGPIERGGEAEIQEEGGVTLRQALRQAG